MPVQYSPPARQTRSQARTQAVLTPTPRRTSHEGADKSRKEGRGPRRSSSFSRVVGLFPGISRTALKGTGEDDVEEEESSVQDKESDNTESSPTPVGEFQGNGGPTLAESNKAVSHNSEPSFLAIMKQMTQIMANLQASSSPPAFKTQYMQAPDCFYVTQPFKVRSFIQSFQLIFHNDKLSNLTKKDPAYLLNNWALFESQLFNLFGDENEVRKSEAELHGLRMKQGGHVLMYIADFRILVSRIEDWGERAFINNFRKGLASRAVAQFASHSRIYSLQDLMDFAPELDTRYH
ncbi:hypothetical protein O181_016960 [Austropuccinia psidii MF-1]|uniref:Retrotransposon gag domain-containing protein n=1 Tax=Austropuccinia psidii MF-1 TaxID=1389203 RepID=A0A9Q3C5X1_9BASI|nr:hypothetical protein [Austropuccinia psidii MF-1]